MPSKKASLLKSSEKPESMNSDCNGLFDALLQLYKLNKDADLAHCLGIFPSTISRIRHGKQPLGAGNLLRIHEITGIGFPLLRSHIRRRNW